VANVITTVIICAASVTTTRCICV